MRYSYIICSLLFFHFSFGQEYSIEYQKSKNLGSSDEIILPFNYELLIVGNNSSFKAKEELPNNLKFDKKMGRLAFSDGGQEVVVYNIATKNHMAYNSFLGNPAIIENNPLVKWDITDETQTIGGYLCYKAIGKLPDIPGLGNSRGRGRVYEAWFTPQIPIRLGPPFYYNLPGLVLFGMDENGVGYLVQSINKKEDNTVSLEKLPTIRHVDYKDYKDQMLLFIKEQQRKQK